MKRREFLRDTLVGAGAFVFSQYAGLRPTFVTASLDSRIEVLMSESLGTISPDVYGHFTEHFGGVIYDGIWVGENSKVPNENGIRKQPIDEMRKIKAPVVRYPGGCFADSYDWRDGVGLRDKCPRRTNFWANDENSQSPASHKYDPNEFGTNEFVHCCKLIGSQPYLAANLRSLPAEEFFRWVEYCNSPRAARLWLTRGERLATVSLSGFDSGESGTSPGGVAATSPPQNMRSNSGALHYLGAALRSGNQSSAWLMGFRRKSEESGLFQHALCVRGIDARHFPEKPSARRPGDFAHGDQAVRGRLLQAAFPTRNYHG